MTKLVLPLHDQPITDGAGKLQLVWRAFMLELLAAVNFPTMPTHIVEELPDASPAARLIFVPDETGGAVLAFSDGTNWRRVTDSEIVS